jgi:hypothetical protein
MSRSGNLFKNILYNGNDLEKCYVNICDKHLCERIDSVEHRSALDCSRGVCSVVGLISDSAILLFDFIFILIMIFYLN